MKTPTILLTIMLVLSACHRQSAEPKMAYQISVQTEPQPARIGPCVIELKLHDALGKPLELSQIAVEATMDHAGMASIYSTLYPTSAPGTFRGTVGFTMAGDWLLIITGTTQQGTALAERVRVAGVLSD